MQSKWLAPIPPYLAIWAGLFIFKSAWLALTGFHLAILLMLAWFRPPLPPDIFFKAAQWKHVLLSIFFSTLSGLGLYLFWNFSEVASDLHEQLAALGLSGFTWLGFIAYFTLVNPFIEEYFWRGFLGSNTKIFYVGDLIYAGYHIMVLWNKAQPLSIVLVVFVLTLAGWFWRQVYCRDGSLLAPVLGHMVADLTILLAVWIKVMK